ncbi:hypothetical protein BS50DRAFT_509351, partial [Corynespora cassiicola Philippines]
EIPCISSHCPRAGVEGFARSDHFTEHLHRVYRLKIPKRRRRKQRFNADGIRKEHEGWAFHT